VRGNQKRSGRAVRRCASLVVGGRAPNPLSIIVVVVVVYGRTKRNEFFRLKNPSVFYFCLTRSCRSVRAVFFIRSPTRDRHAMSTNNYSNVPPASCSQFRATETVSVIYYCVRSSTRPAIIVYVSHPPRPFSGKRWSTISEVVCR